MEKGLDIVDAVFEHGQAIDADAEGEAADFFGVVVHEAIDGGIDHARAEKLDPGRAFAFRAVSAARRCAGAAAEGARSAKFDRGFGEGEIARAATPPPPEAEDLLHELFIGAAPIVD